MLTVAEQKLRRDLSAVTMISLAAGAVIGGWLAEAPYWFSLTGASAAFVFPLLALLLVPVGLAFAELMAVLPYSSSVDVWTCNALGYKMGWATQWLMYLVQVVEPPMMAFIFITAAKYFIPIPEGTITTLVAIGIVLVWYFLSNLRIGFAGTLANIFFYSMIGISLFVAITFLTSGSWSLTNITAHGGWFPLGRRGVFIALAVFSLKFIGFEMTPTLIEEVNFPVKNVWKVVMAALFVPALLYFIVVLALGGMAPWSELMNMTMPEPELVKRVGLPLIIGMLAIISGLLHALTTLMGFWTSSARVLYGAAQLKQLPKQFLKLNRHGQPTVANLVVLLFSVFFCLFTGDNWVQYIYAISCAAAGLVYLIVCVDAIVLRRRFPNWKRPYVAPGGNLVFSLGIIASAWIVIGSLLEMPVGGYISLAIYLAIGVVIYLSMESLRSKQPGEYAPVILTPDDVGKV